MTARSVPCADGIDCVLGRGRSLSRHSGKVVFFEVGDIRDGSLTHKDLSIAVTKADHLAAENEELRQFLARAPETRRCDMRLDIDIPGRGGLGNQFRLSDYRGKIVLLTFSANWCGSCVELHPWQRNLVEKYRDEPFVLLRVTRDETVDTLRASAKSGKITWRCWWDGLDGPIRDAWNCEGIPGLETESSLCLVALVALSFCWFPSQFALRMNWTRDRKGRGQ